MERDKILINEKQARNVLSIFGDEVPNNLSNEQLKYAQYLLDQMVDASYYKAVIDKAMNYLYMGVPTSGFNFGFAVTSDLVNGGMDSWELLGGGSFPIYESVKNATILHQRSYYNTFIIGN